MTLQRLEQKMCLQPSTFINGRINEPSALDCLGQSGQKIQHADRSENTSRLLRYALQNGGRSFGSVWGSSCRQVGRSRGEQFTAQLSRSKQARRTITANDNQTLTIRLWHHRVTYATFTQKALRREDMQINEYKYRFPRI
ncbi:hypothetical protein Tcan_15262 [Toxocara canis]|uniref:Uncharacterized protein n=1 Tax=Toxocara canis TaxID=6265 RepID=A0A0B2VJN5_TOXCA|nr:hypothetical protein Tcan_15262 [Toxocara canis]